MTPLQGRVVIITGASSGFGERAARLFSREGCKVVLAARRRDRLELLAEEIRAAGGDVLPVATDVTKHDQIQAMVKSTIDRYGRIDILFNNAGFGRMDWLEALDPIQDIERQITADLLGVIWTARAVLPQMYRQRSGHIINMSSIAGWAAPPLYSIYSAAKFGIRGFTEALRREATPMGIHVSAIYPGSSPTEFQMHMGENRAKKRFRTPGWLRVTPEEVAQGVVDLAKRPRRSLFLPRLMGLSVFINSHFPGMSDRAQMKAFVPYHEQDLK
jgi:NADP-dependent 3-hydroxy acid dehydrogenase YdfG